MTKLSVRGVDGFEQALERGRLIDRPQALERRAQQLDIAPSQQPHRNNPVIRHTQLPQLTEG
jgi:hypothetical protein